MKEFVAWFEQANADIKTAKNSLESGDYYASAFWSQQSVEKILKGFIIKKEERLIKIHDLVILGRKVGLPTNLLDKCERLSKMYLESRYGIIDGIPSKKFTKIDAANFLSMAEEIIGWVKEKI